jgi:hypothetical protein
LGLSLNPSLIIRGRIDGVDCEIELGPLGGFPPIRNKQDGIVGQAVASRSFPLAATMTIEARG